METRVAGGQVDLGSADRTAPFIGFLVFVPTAIFSTNPGGHKLILDNGAATATLSAAGTDAISTPITINSNLTFVTVTGSSLTASGAITESAPGKNFIFNAGGGSGTVFLGSANTFTGNASLNGGIANVVPGALGTTPNITFGGGTLQYKASTSTPEDFSPRIKSSTGAAAIDANGNTATFASVIDASNTGGLTASSTAANGVLVLSAANLYGGTTTVSSGTLRLGNLNAIPNAGSANSNAVAANGGTLDINGFSPGFNSLNGAGTVDNVSAAGTPTLTLGGNGDSGAFSGAIKNTSGTVALVKAGAGIQGLSGVNTYTGTTTVSAGTLRLVSPGTISVASAVTVSGGATLAGTGTASGSVAVNANGHLAPGINTNGNFGGVGTLTMGSATIASGANLDLDGGAPGTSDLVAVTGALTLPASGSVIVNLISTGALGNGTYKILTFGSLMNTFSAASLKIGFSPLIGATYTFVLNANNTEIDLVIAGAFGSAAGVFSAASYNTTSGGVPLIPVQMSDTNIGLNTNKNYLTAVNINGTALTINSVPFAGVTGNPISAPASNFSLSGCPNAFPGRANNATGSINTLLQNFYYGTLTNPEIVTLSGLTVGQTYVVTYYNQSFSGPTPRPVNITGSDGGSIKNYNEDPGNSNNGAGPGDGNLLRYTFVAIAPTEVLTSVPQSSNNTQHMYGISNELVFNNTWQNGAVWLTANWSNTGLGNTTVVPNYIGANAIFPAQAAPTSIDASGVTTGHIEVDGTNAWAITGSGLTLQTDNAGVAVLNTLSGSHTISAPITLNVTDAVKFGRGTLTLSGAVTGTTGLQVSDGLLVLSTANSYMGATTVNGGTLLLNNPGAIGTGATVSSLVTVSPTGVVDLNGNTPATVPANLSGTGSGAGALTNSSGTAATFGGDITSTSGAFSIGGTGDITLTGAIGGPTAVTLTKVGNNTLTISGSTNNANLTIVVNGGTVILSKGSSTAVHGAVAVVVNSGGILKLSGPGGDQIADTAPVTVNTNGTLDLNGLSEAFDVLSGGGTITNTSSGTTGTVTAGAGGGGGIFTGTIQNGASNTGIVAFTKAGAGTLTFGGTGTYTGATTISAGTLRLSVAASTNLGIIPNFSFETPPLGTGSNAYQYNPTGASWTFTTPTNAGISANGSAFGSVAAPNGTQAGLLQRTGAISQALTFPGSGVYTLTFGTGIPWRARRREHVQRDARRRIAAWTGRGHSRVEHFVQHAQQHVHAHGGRFALAGVHGHAAGWRRPHVVYRQHPDFGSRARRGQFRAAGGHGAVHREWRDARSQQLQCHGGIAGGCGRRQRRRDHQQQHLDARHTDGEPYERFGVVQRHHRRRGRGQRHQHRQERSGDAIPDRQQHILWDDDRQRRNAARGFGSANSAFTVSANLFPGIAPNVVSLLQNETMNAASAGFVRRPNFRSSRVTTAAHSSHRI